MGIKIQNILNVMNNIMIASNVRLELHQYNGGHHIFIALDDNTTGDKIAYGKTKREVYEKLIVALNILHKMER